MSNPIIQVTNLSKSYTITHEGKERYTALRDVMAPKARKLFSLRGACPVARSSIMNFIAMSLPPTYSATDTVDKLLRGHDERHCEESATKQNFEIEQGERVGIIGRNNAGKSTLLKILSRITEPTSGSIKMKLSVVSLMEVGGQALN